MARHLKNTNDRHPPSRTQVIVTLLSTDQTPPQTSCPEPEKQNTSCHICRSSHRCRIINVVILRIAGIARIYITYQKMFLSLVTPSPLFTCRLCSSRLSAHLQDDILNASESCIGQAINDVAWCAARQLRLRGKPSLRRGWEKRTCGERSCFAGCRETCPIPPSPCQGWVMFAPAVFLDCGDWWSWLTRGSNRGYYSCVIPSSPLTP